MRVRALVCLALVAGLATGQARAAKFATYHIHYVSLTPYRVQAKDSLSEYSRADAGAKYLVVSFHEVNGDDVQEEIGSGDIKAFVNGREYDTSGSPSNALTDIVLDPGAKSDGALSWQVPLSAHAAQLRWSPSPFFSDAKWPTYVWDVKF